MTDQPPAEGASGFTCPTCGGALWAQPSPPGPHDQTDGAGRPAEPTFGCRIGHRFEATLLWVEHSAARNRALLFAARALAENGALARRLAAWADERGEAALADRLRQEAADEDRLSEQVQALAGEAPELRTETPGSGGP